MILFHHPDYFKFILVLFFVGGGGGLALFRGVLLLTGGHVLFVHETTVSRASFIWAHSFLFSFPLPGLDLPLLPSGPCALG